MSNFTPVTALAGGALIGLAAAIYVLTLGRVAGISGIVGGLLRPRIADAPLQLAFIIGLVAGPLLVRTLGGPVPAVVVEASLATLIAGAILVGFGTRLSGGCTSGHGVCGVARLSARSLAATALFMVVGAAVVYGARHVLGR